MSFIIKAKIIGVIALVGTVGGGVFYLYKNKDKIFDFLKNTAFGPILKVGDDIKNFVNKGITDAKNVVNKGITDAKNLIDIGNKKLISVGDAVMKNPVFNTAAKTLIASNPIINAAQFGASLTQSIKSGQNPLNAIQTTVKNTSVGKIISNIQPPKIPQINLPKLPFKR